jgi:CubicO group peptidase (beta-lactamase class C family)
MKPTSTRTTIWTAIALLSVSVASATPAAAAADHDLATRVDALVADAMKERQVPGMSVGIERNGEVLLARGYGLADVENSVAATENTVYRIGSVTKQFTAAAILLLAERGAVALDDDVREYLPDYETHGRTITVHQLLNHTCGIKGYTEMEEFWKQGRLDLSATEMMELFGKVPLEFEPGDRWQYSNSGYFLLGLIVEKASGKSYEDFLREEMWEPLGDFLREEMWEPLGLEQTWYLDNAPIVARRAEGYELREDRIVNDDPLSMRLPYSAGSLGSSVEDLMAWQRALVSNRLLEASSFVRMTTPGELNDGKPLTYAYGLSVGKMEGHRKVSHGGGINGFRAQLAWYPDDALTVVVLANSGSANPGPLESAIARAVLGIAERVVQEVPLSGDELKTYAGIYNPGRSPLAVVFRDGGLWLSGQARLLPVGEHRFVRESDVYQDVLFTVENGRATAVRMEREGQVTEASRMP